MIHQILRIRQPQADLGSSFSGVVFTAPARLFLKLQVLDFCHSSIKPKNANEVVSKTS
jgi:hypothetical protein